MRAGGLEGEVFVVGVRCVGFFGAGDGHWRDFRVDQERMKATEIEAVGWTLSLLSETLIKMAQDSETSSRSYEFAGTTLPLIKRRMQTKPDEAIMVRVIWVRFYQRNPA
jgi:hypothetical protein